MRGRDPHQLTEAALAGDRGALARALSLVEQGGSAAAQVDARVHRLRSRAATVGVTGAPGAGKSTLTDRLISEARRGGATVAVLAVDPSSPRSGGAILGDRVRMDDHFRDPGVYIRSMATRGALGGLAVAVPGAVRLLGAVGFDWILVETVGVGQVEVDIAGAADTTIVVVNPGWGDAVQASKAGLIEIADVLVVNKADRPGAAETEADLLAMLAVRGAASDGWDVPVVRTSGTDGTGVTALWRAVADHGDILRTTGGLARRRAQRTRDELRARVLLLVSRRAEQRCTGEEFERISRAVASGSLDQHAAAQLLV